MLTNDDPRQVLAERFADMTPDEWHEALNRCAPEVRDEPDSPRPMTIIEFLRSHTVSELEQLAGIRTGDD